MNGARRVPIGGFVAGTLITLILVWNGVEDYRFPWVTSSTAATAPQQPTQEDSDDSSQDKQYYSPAPTPEHTASPSPDYDSGDDRESLVGEVGRNVANSSSESSSDSADDRATDASHLATAPSSEAVKRCLQADLSDETTLEYVLHWNQLDIEDLGRPVQLDINTSWSETHTYEIHVYDSQCVRRYLTTVSGANQHFTVTLWAGARLDFAELEEEEEGKYSFIISPEEPGWSFNGERTQMTMARG